MPTLDLGDIALDFALRVKGQRRYRFDIRVGVPRKAMPADRAVNPPPYATNINKEGGVLMDLKADKKVSISPKWTDEMKNPVPAPDGASVTWTVDDPTILAVSTDEDGVTWVAATGVLGSAFVHGEAVIDGGAPITGDLGVVVVAGDAARFDIVTGEPVEVTPDA